MSRHSRFRGAFNKQQRKGDQTLSKSDLHHLYQIYWSLWRKLSCKNHLLVISKFLRLFLHTLTAHDKYSLLNRDPLRQPIQMQLSQKGKRFSQLLPPFLEAKISFQNFQKKMTVIADVFSKLRATKNMIKKILKKSRFREPFRKQHIRGNKHCWSLNHFTFTIFLDHCSDNSVGKNLS